MISSILETINLYKRPIHLRLNKKENYYSCIDIFMSLAFYAMIIASLVYNIIDAYIIQVMPIVSKETILNNTKETINTSSLDYVLHIFKQEKISETFDLNENLIGSIVQYRLNFTTIFDKEQIGLFRNCSNLKYNNLVYKNLKENSFLRNNLLCSEFNKTNIQIGGSSIYSKGYKILFIKNLNIQLTLIM